MAQVSEASIEDELRIQVNGVARLVPAGTSVSGLLRLLGVARDHVAVELDGELLEGRSGEDWELILLSTCARIEIVRFVGGG